MKTTLLLILATFVLTTAFTCSKNPPAPEVKDAEVETQPAQEQMAAPADTATPPAGETPPPETEKPAAETK
ncbi:MAG: hypothetical protein AABY64_13815 [Bdellovibrionota bacterium]